MNNSAYLTQVEKKVKRLITDKRYREAHNLCISILDENPGHKVFEKLKKRIEETVAGENEKLINEKLKTVKALYKEEKYAEALKLLKELLRINPNNKHSKKEYERVQKAYVEKVEQQKKEFISRQTNRFNEILNKHPDLLLEELVSLEMNNPGSKLVRDLTDQFRAKLIRKKINEKGELLKSKKFDAIENFIKELGEIDKKNPLVLKLAEEIAKRRRQTASAQKSEFVYGGSKHLDTLMKLKKYDKAIQVAKEILAVNKSNKMAFRTMKKAKRKLYAQTRNLSIKDINDKRAELKKEYKANKEEFVKI